MNQGRTRLKEPLRLTICFIRQTVSIRNNILLVKPFKPHYYGKKKKSNIKMNFPTNEFYVNNSSKDGLHPYTKKADNFRRRTGINASDLRQMFNNLFETAI
jgi:hypothetical protein